MARRIACGHCGGAHGSVADVRHCSLHPSDEAAVPQNRNSVSSTAENGAGDARPEASPDAPLNRSAEWLAGPPPLGRSLLLGSDQAVPEPWIGSSELAVDNRAGRDLTDRLHEAWRERQPLIIRWAGPLPDSNPTLDKAFHQLSVDEELPGERLAFAVLANSVNLLGPEPTFAPLARAVALGATLTRSDRTTDNGGSEAALEPDTAEPVIAEPEMVVPGGVSAWADGGPLDLDLPGVVGAPIVPRVHLLAGSVKQLDRRQPAGAELAPDQLVAVEHRRGPARILAPAGSGKTRVLTERTRHLITDCGLEARTVSLVAYNRRAKDEMRTRLTDIAGLDIRTLNSLALAIATSSGPFHTGAGGRRPTTIGELEVRRLLDRVVPGRRRKKLTDPLEPWIDALSACRLGLRDPHEVEAAYGGDVAGFSDVLAAYRQELARADALDFDEQILRAIERLLRDPAARATARSVAPVLLVDEFQDLTPAHLLLLRVIGGPAGELFGVGDDDQTIYGYAGASPDWLIRFSEFFPGATDHRLTVNYRCPPDVVEAAVNLLSHNRRRVDKEIRAASSPEREPAGGPGSEPAAEGDDPASSNGAGLVVYPAGDPQQNLQSHVRSLIADGARPSEISVLTRVNAALLPAAVFLSTDGIPVTRPYGLSGDVLDRSGVGAALSWLRLAVGPAQGFTAEDLRLALRRPPRSLHPRVSDWVCEQRSVKDLVALSNRLNKEREAASVAEFAADVQTLRGAVEDGRSTQELLTLIYDEVGLLGAASQLDRSQRSARRAAHADELAALAAVASLNPDPVTFETWLRQELDDIPTFDPEQPTDSVVLATIHTTKGLEWPHVIVHDVRDGLYPHRLAEDTEEERRIFHVAVTRGRQSVAVTVSGPRSPFVAELAQRRPEDLAWPSEDEKPAAVEPVKSRSARRERAEPSTAGAAAIRDALTEYRRDRSKADGVPAYVVLDNKTLDAVAEAAPDTLGALGNIGGIGPAKLDRYGADILGLIASIDDD